MWGRTRSLRERGALCPGSFDDFSAHLHHGWSDDNHRAYGLAVTRFAAQPAARRALGASTSRARQRADLAQMQLAAVAPSSKPETVASDAAAAHRP